MSSEKIKKYFESSLKIINQFDIPNLLKISGGASFFDKKEMSIIKEQSRLKIKVQFVNSDRHYYNVVSDRKIEAYELINKENTYYVPKKATHMTSFNSTNGEYDEEFNFTFKGEIDQLGTLDLKEFDGKYHRLLIPFNQADNIFKDFHRWNFISDVKSGDNTLIKIKFEELEFHLFNFSIEKQQYWGVDSMQNLDFEKFKSIAYSALNAYGFIKGNIYLREAYYFASDDSTFRTEYFHYSLIRDSINTHYRIFTTNPYSVYNAYHHDRGEKLDVEEVGKWNSELSYFSEGVFSKLVEIFFKNESLSRSALIVLEANAQPLELKAASYCVAYEGICHTIKKIVEINSPNVIDSINWEKKIKPEFESLLKTLRGNNQLDENQEKILSSKINNLNQPTNRDVLTAPFLKFGYNLNPIEIKCIGNRNIFLHGSLPVKTFDEDESFKKLYFNSIYIHRLIYILVLKLIGFEGYIINYPKLHEQNTGEINNEKLFLLI